MSNQYYYFAASLPMLDIESPLEMTTEGFLQECERLLSAEDFDDMQLALSETSSPRLASNRMLQKWVEFNRRLRNEIAWFRAVEANKDPSDYIRGDRYVQPFMVDAVLAASKAANPLEGERIIERVRWRKLNELELEHYFDFEFLIIYGLRLKILERYNVVKSPKGEEILNSYFEDDLPEFEHV